MDPVKELLDNGTSLYVTDDNPEEILEIFDTRAKFYCSQLVWASYLDLYEIDLNTSTLGSIITPMELVNTDKTYTIYSKTTD